MDSSGVRALLVWAFCLGYGYQNSASSRYSVRYSSYSQDDIHEPVRLDELIRAVKDVVLKVAEIDIQRLIAKSRYHNQKSQYPRFFDNYRNLIQREQVLLCL